MRTIRSIIVLTIGSLVLATGTANANQEPFSPGSSAETVQTLHDELKANYEAGRLDAVEAAVARLDPVLAGLLAQDDLARIAAKSTAVEADELNTEAAAELAAMPPQQKQVPVLPGVVPALGVLLGSLLATLTELVTHLLVIVPVPPAPPSS